MVRVDPDQSAVHGGPIGGPTADPRMPASIRENDALQTEFATAAMQTILREFVEELSIVREALGRERALREVAEEDHIAIKATIDQLQAELVHERERREAAENALVAHESHETPREDKLSYPTGDETARNSDESPHRADRDALTIAQAPTEKRPSFFQRIFAALRSG